MGDYRATLNLPKTDFPMKAGLPVREPQRLQRWEESGFYTQLRVARKGAPRFVLHDGPPYANGEIHMGHALNKILKDIIVRYKTMQGFDAPYVPGWDCHGLPIEHALLKEMGKRKEEVPRNELRKAARAYAQRYIDIQREGFKRLGISGDWARPYLTMDYGYQAAIADCFLILFEKQFIERRLKPVPWCSECQTALADAELEYEQKNSESIYVKFRVDPAKTSHPLKACAAQKPLSVVVWTTTPWTLPANVGIAFHEELTYCLVDDGKEQYLFAKSLMEKLKALFGWGDSLKIVDQFLGESLVGLEAQHPFLPRTSKGILADFVSSEEGTGVVHIAPGHGEEDYQVGHLEYGLAILSPVDEQGRFTKEFAPAVGQHVFKANKAVIDILRQNGALLGEPQPHAHSYPHCWRCKKPILFRATQQWFLSVDHNDLRRRCLEVIEKKIRFVPEWGKNRIGSMMETRPDWCLSRQRSWGVPIPVITCTGCGKIYASELRAKVVATFQAHGADSWFELPAESFLPAKPTCCASPVLRKEEDIIDVWFDSGSSHHAVLIPRVQELSCPADLYLEGSDQHRGWFQTSLLVSMGVHDRAPFKSLLTHGFVVDGQGRKMSKSLGNVIAPQEIMKTHGADILRLWVASCDYAEDVRLSPQIVEQVAETYRKIRNTLRYLLGNLADFQPERDRVAPDRLLPVDAWAVSRAAQVVTDATAAYEAYEFHKVVRILSQFCTVELSNFYLDSLKDRLYTLPAADPVRRSGQTAMAEILETLVKLSAPILVFTAEEAWESYGRFLEPGGVHLSRWLKRESSMDVDAQDRWIAFFQIRDLVLKALEERRNAGVIGDPAEAHIKVAVHDAAVWGRISSLLPWMAELLMVSSAEVLQQPGEGTATVQAEHAPGQKCQRCWRYTQDVGRSKEHPGLCARCVGALSMNERVSS